MGRTFTIIGGILGVILVVILIILSTRQHELTIIDKHWERQVIVEEYRTVQEEGWSIPTGGRKTGQYQDIYTYQQVFDHYDYTTESRTVPDGGHYEVVGHDSEGNPITEWVTDYRTEYYTESEPVYRQEPVYRTKYQYDIERWVFDHYETTNGRVDAPYFATPNLTDNFRTNGTKEKYTVTATKNRDDSKVGTYTLNFEDWSSVKIDQTVRVKKYVGNHIELIKDDE